LDPNVSHDVAAGALVALVAGAVVAGAAVVDAPGAGAPEDVTVVVVGATVVVDPLLVVLPHAANPNTISTTAARRISTCYRR
jgi:hypothetical protein